MITGRRAAAATGTQQPLSSRGGFSVVPGLGLGVPVWPQVCSVVERVSCFLRVYRRDRCSFGSHETRWCGVALAVVRDLREARVPAGPDELAAFETDTLAGLVLARAAAGLEDSTIAGEVIHLEQVRAWLGLPLWAMQPADADDYFGQVLRGAARGTRLARAQALKTYFLFLELRHKAEIQHAGIMAATARPGTPPGAFAPSLGTRQGRRRAGTRPGTSSRSRRRLDGSRRVAARHRQRPRPDRDWARHSADSVLSWPAASHWQTGNVTAAAYRVSAGGLEA